MFAGSAPRGGGPEQSPWKPDRLDYPRNQRVSGGKRVPIGDDIPVSGGKISEIRRVGFAIEQMAKLLLVEIARDTRQAA
jgi:hypothetical protein